MEQVHDWFRRLLARGTEPLDGMYDIGYEYNRIVGARSVFGRVKLSIEPNDVFSFRSKVTWPSGNHDDMVLDGILDALVGWEYKLPVAQFSLVDIGWHPIHSAPIAYYWAAKRAVSSWLIGRGQDST